MAGSPVMAVGAVCFGAVVGLVTYRTLIRAGKTSITDLGAVVSVVGGAAVTGLFNPDHSDLFGWYSIGLAAGMAVYLALFRIMNGKQKTAAVMGLTPGADVPPLPPGGPTQ